MVTNEEKCDLCGCRGGSTICYYNCGCHNKQKDEKVLPKNGLQETAVKLIDLTAPNLFPKMVGKSEYTGKSMPQTNRSSDISYNTMYFMSKTSNKAKTTQKNKNNKKMPENLMKKQYLQSFKEMKQELKYDSN